MQVRDPAESKLVKIDEIDIDENQRIIEELIEEIGVEVLGKTIEKLDENLVGKKRKPNLIESLEEEVKKESEEMIDTTSKIISEEKVKEVEILKTLDKMIRDMPLNELNILLSGDFEPFLEKLE